MPVKLSNVELSDQDIVILRAALAGTLPPTPPVYTPPASIDYPARFVGPKVFSTLPFISGARVFSSGFNDSNIWAIAFTTDGLPHIVFIEGAEESPYQPVDREVMLVEQVSGKVLFNEGFQRTISFRCAMLGANTLGMNLTELQPRTSYVLMIRNTQTGGGEMGMDLILQ